jgi:plasmid stabilization system protein ParE
MQYTLVFTPEAEAQLVAIYQYIAAAASPKIAEQFTNAIVSCCEGLTTFPYRSAQHNDIRPGFLITNYKKELL